MILRLLLALFACGGDPVTYKISVADDEIGYRLPWFAAQTIYALNESGGWSRAGVNFCPAMNGKPDVHIVLALPDTVDELCDPIHTVGEVSCAIHGRAVINYKRWTDATDAWDDLGDYRRYVINHEVGHVMGMIHMHKCTKSGAAPLMMQQSRNKIKCAPNSYPTSHEALSLRRVMEKRNG